MRDPEYVHDTSDRRDVMFNDAFLRYHPPCTSKSGNESATFFKHGNVYMDRQSQAEFFSRSLYDMCRYYANQIPKDVGFIVNPDTFLSAFEYRNEQGDVAQVPAWQMAPRVEVDQPKATEIKEEYEKGRKLWDQHYMKVAGMIPTHFLRSAELRLAASMGRGK